MPSNDPKPPALLSLDALLAQTLVREGTLHADQLDAALKTQRDLRARGTTVPLGDLLVREGLVAPEDLPHFLHCPKCSRNYFVKNWSPDRAVYCQECSTALVAPAPVAVIDAAAPPPLPPAPDPDASKGVPFGRYRLLGELGRGGMGVVWKAWDSQLKRAVALKQILGDAEQAAEDVERFMGEARAAARLRHPGIIPIHDVGVESGHHFFTMDYIEGGSLREAAKKGLPLRRALEIVRDVSLALHYAHEQGVIHRDIKPANILLDPRGTPYVMDFGLAKDISRTAATGLTLSGQVLGTPSYMSPEHTKGNMKNVGPAADQFSLGVMLYELATGRLPFQAEGVYELLRAIVERDPPPLGPAVPPDVRTICLKAMEKDPARRYASAEEFARDLQRFLNNEPILAHPPSTVYLITKTVMRHRLAAAALAVAIVALAAGGFFGWRSWRAAVDRRRAEAAATSAEARSTQTQRTLKLWEEIAPVFNDADRMARDGEIKKSRDRLDEGTKLCRERLVGPPLPQGHYFLGKLLAARGNLQDARREFDAALKLNPDLSEARLARALILIGDYDSLVQLRRLEYQPRVAAKAKEGESESKDVSSADLEKNYGELVQLRERIAADLAAPAHLSQYFKNTDRLFGNAELARVRGELDQAEALLKDVLKNDPRYEAANLALARVAAARKDPDAAIAFAEEALKLHRGRLDAYRLLSELWLSTAKAADLAEAGAAADRAIDFAQKAIGLGDDSGDVFAARADARSRKAEILVDSPSSADAAPLRADALAVSDEALRRAPGDAGVLARRGWFHYRMFVYAPEASDAAAGYLKAFDDDFAAAAAAHPQDLSVYRSWAAGYVRQAEFESKRDKSLSPKFARAHEVLQLAVARLPDVPVSHEFAAEAWETQGASEEDLGLDPAESWQKSIAAYTASIEKGANADVVFSRGNRRRFLADHYGLDRARSMPMFDESAADMAEACRRDPKRALFHNVLGLALMEKGWWADAPDDQRADLYAKAIESMQEGLKLDPDGYDLHRNLGVTLFRLSYVAPEPERAARLSEAIAEEARAIDLKCRDPGGWSWRSIMLEARAEAEDAAGRDSFENYARAILDATTAIAANRELGDKVTIRARLRVKAARAELTRDRDPSGLLAGARADYEKLLDMGHQLAQTLTDRSAFWSLREEADRRFGRPPEGAYRAAIEDCSNRIFSHPDDAIQLHWRATAASRIGELLAEREEDPTAAYADAIRDYDTYVLRAPADAWGSANRATVRFSLAEWQDAHEGKPERGYRAAIDDLTEAIRVDGTVPSFFVKRGEVAARLGIWLYNHQRLSGTVFEKSMDDYAHAFEMKPDEIDWKFYRGRVARWKGYALRLRNQSPIPAFSEAVADLRAALDVRPDDAKVLADLAGTFDDMAEWCEGHDDHEGARQARLDAARTRKSMKP